jgi:hypothetical protein
MLVTGIKSKPVYAPLRADTRGRFHLMLGVGEGEAALLRVLREMQSQAPQALGATRVLLAPGPLATDSPAAADGTAAPPAADRVSAAGGGTAADCAPPAGGVSPAPLPSLCVFAELPLRELRSFSDVPLLLAELRSSLEVALMGTRLYVAGPESFIGLAMKLALEFDLNQDEIRAEEIGTRARRVYCVHCRDTAEDVRTNIVACAGCGRWLLVRDHYSRRLAAYMGVMVDAEAPGQLPPIQETFP